MRVTDKRPSFSATVIAWQKAHGRHNLPWQAEPDNRRLSHSLNHNGNNSRKTKSHAQHNAEAVRAYRVWLSEIMLQQTQVATVIPYFERFVARFADIAALAAATQDEVLHLWSGLGYYSRARNLHKAARIIVREHAGIFPRDFEAIVALPGIGVSTAGAILSQAFNEPAVMLDANARRFLCRAFCIKHAGNPYHTNLVAKARELLPAKRGNNAAHYTQGLMDLGATICTQRAPKCDICPIRTICESFKQGRIANFPETKPKKPKPTRYARFFALSHGAHVLLKQRASPGVWAGLWCLPTREELATLPLCGAYVVATEPYIEAVHTFSHYHLAYKIMKGDMALVETLPTGWLWYNLVLPPPVGLPRPISAFLQTLC